MTKRAAVRADPRPDENNGSVDRTPPTPAQSKISLVRKNPFVDGNNLSVVLVIAPSDGKDRAAMRLSPSVGELEP